MNKALALLLLCPLAAAAADWQYDGTSAGETATATSTSAGETTTSAPQSSTGAMTMGGSAGPAPPGAPDNNMTMDKVRGANGDPETILGSVGEPPITRWQYPEYVVYFEHDRVITSVAGRW